VLHKDFVAYFSVGHRKQSGFEDSTANIMRSEIDEVAKAA